MVKREKVRNMRSYKFSGNKKNVYYFVREYFLSHGYAPSLEEIKQATNMASKSNVSEILKQLEVMGLIRYVPGKKRNIQLVGFVCVRDPSIKLSVVDETGRKISL